VPRYVPDMHWRSEDLVDRGVRQRGFDLEHEGRLIPGLLWTPDGARGPRPLVLIGHGGSNNKRQDYVVALARRLVRHHGYAAAAIDGPVHGDRRADGGKNTALTFLEFGQAWSSHPSMTDEMVSDWRRTLDSLQTLEDVGTAPVGWWGLSMGTILGLPVVAAEPRVEAAVFGLMGRVGPTCDRITEDALKVHCPVLYLVQWDDELFDRERAFELFDLIGSEDKRLHANPGGHGEVPRAEFEASERFLAERLGRAGCETGRDQEQQDQ